MEHGTWNVVVVHDQYKSLFIIFLVRSVCCRVLHNTLVDAHGLYGVFGAYIVFNGMLLVLQALHIFWFYLILRMLHQYVIHGQVRKPLASSSHNIHPPWFQLKILLSIYSSF